MIKPGGENLPAIKAVLIAVTVSSFTEKARNSVVATTGCSCKGATWNQQKGEKQGKEQRTLQVEGQKKDNAKNKDFLTLMLSDFF